METLAGKTITLRVESSDTIDKDGSPSVQQSCTSAVQQRFLKLQQLHAGKPTNCRGARVAVECKDHSGKKLFYNEGQTDDNGLFNILVKGEHEHELCEAYTVSNPTLCNVPADSSHGPVSLTHNNGIDSNDRKIRPVAFISTESHPTWQAVIAEYTAVDCTAGPAIVINVGARRVLRQVDNEGQELLARRRNCCKDEYCPSCHWHVAEEEAVDADLYADPYVVEEEASIF